MDAHPDKPEEVSSEPLTAEQDEFLKEIEKAAAANEPAEEDNKSLEDSKYDYYKENNYTINPKVGLVFTDSKVISTQRTLVFGIIKRAGSNLFRGKSIMNTSLPINAFEPYSTLDRVASLCCYAPKMLLPLTEIMDPVERLKRVMAWAVATMHLGISQQKPINCTLGETMQAKIGDLSFYGEYTEHNPPTILLTGKDFRMYGNYEIIAYTYPNSAKVKTHGSRTIEFFGANPAKYTLTHPEVSITGLMMGKREFRCIGNVTFEDLTNKLYGQIRMNPCKKGFFSSLFSRQNYRDDHFKGFITKNRGLLDNKENSVFNSKDIISKCEGNWIDNISFNGKAYWEIGRIAPCPVTRIDDVLLPSDTSFRADINALANGDCKEAQKLKDLVEEAERKDNKLREEIAKNRKAAAKSLKKKQ
eukprot:TRINITY_DN3011_c0_g1_i1.p1 TRINITY_DN3011_c0_g1~~TRINITY_DN3011_c0_g1_i1.p1  ORF type:complete len:476 (-),score=50.97 TRINITY_DN3011_c0_g1_i1:2060-3307(-)